MWNFSRKKKYTFKGGAHVTEYKNTRHIPIERMPAPPTVAVPLSQHIGAPCRPLVSPSDHVDYGQIIGDTDGLGCPVHASVSGKVLKIAKVTSSTGAPVDAVVLENDGLYTLCPDVKPFPKPLEEATPDELVELIRNAGIAGMGGATFPTYAKLKSAIGRADTLIINSAECEPFITANHRMMLEHPRRIVVGTGILMHALGLDHAIIAVEDNKPDAIELLKKHAANAKGVEIVTMKTKYPQGDERQIIYALTGKELPAGKLPADLGCVLFNAETVAAIWHAFTFGTPLCKRVVTIDGDCVARPSNIKVPIGTSYRDLLAHCGGLVKQPAKIINGGPMMGFAQWDLDGVVTKGTSAVLVLSEEFCKKNKCLSEPSCIRCGRCVAHCPMHLTPNMLVSYAKQRRFDDAAAAHAMSCVECGTCAYHCPAGIPLVQHIRVAKNAIRMAQMAARAKETEKKGEEKHGN
ncbi:MAG: electron transport complex subunit RsxC [Clostridia bacterium]|nr:electron transport complex subunit RsxC [Clostridia bacterium]